MKHILPFGTDAGPLHAKWHEIWNNYFCTERASARYSGSGHGSRTLAHRELPGRVIIVVVIVTVTHVSVASREEKERQFGSRNRLHNGRTRKDEGYKKDPPPHQKEVTKNRKRGMMETAKVEKGDIPNEEPQQGRGRKEPPMREGEDLEKAKMEENSARGKWDI